jgi:hypothetical protein
MPTGTFNYSTDSERLAIEQAILYAQNLNKAAHAAPVGRVLNACEKMALTEGKKLLRTTLEAAVQSRIGEAEQKGAKPVPAQDVPPPSGTKASTLETCLRPSDSSS